jgi:hypothetical protein
MHWGEPLFDRVAPPSVVIPLLERAVAAAPGNAALHAKLGHASLGFKDYPGAAAAFEAALRLDEERTDLPPLLARCYNYLGRFRDAVDILAGDKHPSFQRGRALLELGATAPAEAEFRAVLARNPDHPEACRLLCRLLRRAERNADMVELCESLGARGAANAQLLYNWGWALALAGEKDKARRLMFDPERVATFAFPPPDGFEDLAAFNAALAAAILASPDKISLFPEEDEASRGSQRVDNLFAGPTAELTRLLLGAVRDVVETWRPWRNDGFDPWWAARPVEVRPRPWGLIQRGDAFEEGHIHPGGWLSGVYYVRIPGAVSGGDGPGCIEFGPPSGLDKILAGFVPARRYVPAPGMLLLAPSHYQHRTIPSGVDEDRISLAFDLVPVRKASDC